MSNTIKLDYHAMRKSAQALRTAETALRTAKHALDPHDLEQGAPPALVASIREAVTSARRRVDYVADSTDRMHRLLHKRADRAEFEDGGTFGGPGLWLPHLMFKGKSKGLTRFNGEDANTEWRKGKDGRWTKHQIPPSRKGTEHRGPDKKEKWDSGFLGFNRHPGQKRMVFVEEKPTIDLRAALQTHVVAGVGAAAVSAAAAGVAAGVGGRKPTGEPAVEHTANKVQQKLVKGGPLQLPREMVEHISKSISAPVKAAGGYVPRAPEGLVRMPNVSVF